MDLATILTRAQNAPRQTTDVEVVFDAGITTELEAFRQKRSELLGRLDDIDADLQAELEQLAGDDRAGDPRPAAAEQAADVQRAAIEEELAVLERDIERVEEDAAGFVVTFRFTALLPFEWKRLTDASEPRSGNVRDQNLGYDYDTVTRMAATRSGQQLHPDGSLADVSAEQWATIFDTLPPVGQRAIQQYVWTVNEYAGIAARDAAVDAARKASTGPTVSTPPSLPTSASRPAVSKGGNRSKSPATTTTTPAG